MMVDDAGKFPKVTPKRIRLSEHISVSQTRSEKNCCVCRQKMHPGEYGLIVYLVHETFKFYSWIHLSCIRALKDLKKVKGQYEDIFIYVSKSSTLKCSYCGKDTGSRKILRHFAMHPECIDKILEDLKPFMPKIVAMVL